MYKDYLLQNKYVLVTGGTSGIGKAVASLFASKGANVVIVGRNEEKAKETTTLLEEKAPSSQQILTYKIADVSSFSAAKEMQKELEEKVPAFDILVNSAGIVRDRLLLRMTEEDFDEVIAVNLKGVFNVCKAFLPPMLKQRKGAIVNISSVIGVTGNAGQANYAASKGGVISFTKSLAREIGPRNLRANVIAPGYTDTPMTQKLPDTLKKAAIEKIPLRRLASPEEVAKAAFFLASGEMSGYITGQTLHVDGGMVM